MVLAIWLGGELPAAPFWRGEPAYQEILGHTPRILMASFVAYLIGEFANAFVLAKLKIATHGRWLWMRTIGSTVVGQALDSVVFVTLAFAGIVPAGALAGIVAGQGLPQRPPQARPAPPTPPASGGPPPASSPPARWPGSWPVSGSSRSPTRPPRPRSPTRRWRG